MRFAIEPNRVRFPAKVELIAIVSQMNDGDGTRGTTGSQRMTAGTFDTRFESASIAAEVTTASWTGEPCSWAPAALVSDATSGRSRAPRMTTNSAPKNN